MIKYLNNNELMEREQKYMFFIEDALRKGLGSIITQLTNQSSIIENLNENSIKNKIQHSIEKIIPQIINFHLNWNICSQSGSSDECFENGDSIVNIDEKTYLMSEGTKINVEKNQTTYISGEILEIGKSKNYWEPSLNPYVKHKDFGYIPNLTYVVRVRYDMTTEEPLAIQSIDLICLPHAQLADVFNKEEILSAGKTKKDGFNNNVRFDVDKIAQIQPWRVRNIFTKVNKPIID